MISLENFINKNTQPKPEPCSFCDYCSYRSHCKKIWKTEKSIFEISGVTRNQVLKLSNAGINNLEELINAKEVVSNFHNTIFEKLKLKARLRFKRLNGGEPEYKIISGDRSGVVDFLPKENSNDLYFDIEGDPLFDEGLEYLFGFVVGNQKSSSFKSIWAHNKYEEKKAAKEVITFLYNHCEQNPNAHIYHYNSYEVTALRRLSQKYAVLEEELDTLLRAERFVDLYKFIQKTIVTSEKGLSLKDLEVFFIGKRTDDVVDAASSVVMYEKWRDNNDPNILKDIETYNEQDCRSMPIMRKWLEETVFENRIQHRLPRDFISTNGNNEPEDVFDNEDEAFANAISTYHKREQKPYWWKVFDAQLRDLNELLPDASVFAGLNFKDIKGSVYEYEFEDQEHKFASGQTVRIVAGESNGQNGNQAKIISLDEKQNKLSVTSSRQINSTSPIIFERSPPNTQSIERVLNIFFEAIKSQKAKTLFPLAYNILQKEEGLQNKDEFRVNNIEEHQRHGTSQPIFIQGPPGTGKTFLASNYLSKKLESTDKHKIFVITSQSHKAIENLLIATANKISQKSTMNIFKYGGEKLDENKIGYLKNKDELAIKISEFEKSNTPIIVGMTVFAICSWGRPFDLIVVDEAGQYSLSNSIAASLYAKQGIFLGDQNQLPNVSQASHPYPVDTSVMDHSVGSYTVIPSEAGIFINETWRLHPKICDIISHAYYDGRLTPSKNMPKRAVFNKLKIDMSGFNIIRLSHSGCSQRSFEEIKKIQEDYNNYLSDFIYYENGNQRKLSINDILVVAPFNAQVKSLAASLPEGARVGTVDKFQGQEAPICMISMTSSSGNETPRGIEFLLNQNRLNVAISRAMCIASIYMSDELFETECKNLSQMKLLNDLIYLNNNSQ